MASAGRKLLWSAGAALASAPRAGAGRWLHSSAVAFEVFRLEVPSLGDSVPEGIIEEQLKSPGDAVEMDEPVATIATDKVVVEVRSPVQGVLKGFPVAEGDTVNVGDLVAEIDTDGDVAAAKSKAASPAPAPSQAAPAPAPSPAPASAPAPSPAPAPGGRVPLIKFRHGKANQASSAGEQAQASSSSSTGGSVQGTLDFEALFPSKASKDFLDTQPGYGRPVLSEAEMDAIDSGGASGW